MPATPSSQIFGRCIKVTHRSNNTSPYNGADHSARASGHLSEPRKMRAERPRRCGLGPAPPVGHYSPPPRRLLLGSAASDAIYRPRRRVKFKNPLPSASPCPGGGRTPRRCQSPVLRALPWRGTWGAQPQATPSQEPEASAPFLSVFGGRRHPARLHPAPALFFCSLAGLDWLVSRAPWVLAGRRATRRSAACQGGGGT
jgi:hypothetical protein